MMKLNKLLMLNESLVERVQRSTFQSAVPISPIKPPIKAIEAWENRENKLIKSFAFKDTRTRNQFVMEVLSYEEEKGHHGRMVILKDRVKVLIFTEGLTRVTELDKEYTKGVDSIYVDLVKEL